MEFDSQGVGERFLPRDLESKVDGSSRIGRLAGNGNPAPLAVGAQRGVDHLLRTPALAERHRDRKVVANGVDEMQRACRGWDPQRIPRNPLLTARLTSIRCPGRRKGNG